MLIASLYTCGIEDTARLHVATSTIARLFAQLCCIQEENLEVHTPYIIIAVTSHLQVQGSHNCKLFRSLMLLLVLDTL